MGSRNLQNGKLTAANAAVPQLPIDCTFLAILAILASTAGALEDW